MPETPTFANPLTQWTAGALCGGPEVWLKLFEQSGPGLESPLLVGLAEAAPRAVHDLSALEPVVRTRLRFDGTAPAAGAALWRLTWRVNRAWLESLNPQSEQLESDSPLVAVLTEHLGRRPDLAPAARLADPSALVRERAVRLQRECSL